MGNLEFKQRIIDRVIDRLGLRGQDLSPADRALIEFTAATAVRISGEVTATV